MTNAQKQQVKKLAALVQNHVDLMQDQQIAAVHDGQADQCQMYIQLRD